MIDEDYYIGSVVNLMRCSELYRDWTIDDIERLIWTPIDLGQALIFCDPSNKQVVAFASWAFLTDKVARLFVKGERKLHPTDWAAGDQLWIVDLIAPFGDLRKVVRFLANEVHADQTEARWLRRRGMHGVPDRRAVHVPVWRNKERMLSSARGVNHEVH